MQRKSNNETALSAESQPTGTHGPQAPPDTTTLRTSDRGDDSTRTIDSSPKETAKRKEPSSGTVPTKKMKVVVQRGRMGARKKPTKLKYAAK